MGHFKMLKPMEMLRLKRAAPNSTSPSSQAEDVFGFTVCICLNEANLLSPTDSVRLRKKQARAIWTLLWELPVEASFKKKKNHHHNKAAASSNKVEGGDSLSVVVWMEKTAVLRTSNKLFLCTAPHLSGDDFQSTVVHLRWSESKQISQAACTDWPCYPESF